MKKIIIILSLFSFSFSELCDFNNDNSLNIVDIVIMVNSILNDGEYFCDLNGDNLLNIVDVVQLVNIVLYGINVDFVNITAGHYNNPENEEPVYINYEFQIGKYEITNQQYLKYLNTAINENEIWIGECIDNLGNECVNGNVIYNGLTLEKSFFILGENYSHLLNEYNFGIIQFIDFEFHIDNIIYLNHPVVHVSWHGANHFAEYYNFRLPTYDEWMRTAREETTRNWPWGPGGDMYLKINTLNSQYGIPEDFIYPWDDGTTPVGFYNEQNGMVDNASPFGVYDLIGNVSEWIFNPVQYNNDIKIAVGGGWDWEAYNSRLKWNSKYTLGESNWSTGFRVVKDN